MKTSDKGIELIKSHEGRVLTAYKCPAGVWTIGYGHTADVSPGMVIDETRAEELLRSDLKTAETAVSRQNLNINQNQFDALVSFVFNVGPGNFERSTLMRKAKLNENDHTIAGEFAKWKYGGGRVLPGLVKRRKDEAELYFS